MRPNDLRLNVAVCEMKECKACPPKMRMMMKEAVVEQTVLSRVRLVLEEELETAVTTAYILVELEVEECYLRW